MAGNGPAPKDPSKRARRNKDAVQFRTIEVTPAEQPELPSFSITVKQDGMISTQEFEWPEPTREWWAMLAHHPLRHEFTGMDWSYLLDTARLHAAFWLGRIELASELRLREAKYGFTPDDRLKLRLLVASTAGAEADAVTKQAKAVSVRDRYRGARPSGEIEGAE